MIARLTRPLQYMTCPGSGRLASSRPHDLRADKFLCEVCQQWIAYTSDAPEVSR